MTPFVGGRHEFIQNNVRLLEARTCLFYLGTGLTPAMSVNIVGGGSPYAVARLDADRNYLDDSKTYRLHVPPNVSVKPVWSLIPTTHRAGRSCRSAEANLDVLVDAIRSNRKALVAVNLKLTDDEAAKLWQPCTPAMAAGLTDLVWTLREVLLFRVAPWPQPATL